LFIYTLTPPPQSTLFPYTTLFRSTGGHVKFQGLPKAPAAPPGTFDAVRDGLVDLSYVTASYTPARHILPLMAELPGMADTSEVKDRKSTRLNSSHVAISYAVFCLK